MKLYYVEHEGRAIAGPYWASAPAVTYVKQRRAWRVSTAKDYVIVERTYELVSEKPYVSKALMKGAD